MQSQNLYSSSCGGGLSSATTQDDMVPCSESLLNGKSLASYKKMIKEIELDESSSTSKKSNNDEDSAPQSVVSAAINCGITSIPGLIISGRITEALVRFGLAVFPTH